MTDTLSFTVSDIPPDDGFPPNAPADSKYSCVVCGTPLVYAGRGKPPSYCADHKKSSTGSSRASTPRRNTRDVEAAMATLTAGHDGLSFAMMLLAPSAAIQFESKRPSLNVQCEAILTADPALAKRIAAMAGKGGGFALVMAHLIALAPSAGIVVGTARASANERKARKAQETQEYVETYATTPVADPDFVFSGVA